MRVFGPSTALAPLGVPCGAGRRLDRPNFAVYKFLNVFLLNFSALHLGHTGLDKACAASHNSLKAATGAAILLDGAFSDRDCAFQALVVCILLNQSILYCVGVQ